MADRRRPLKTVTGVSGGAVSIYDAAIDPTTSTVASAIDVAKTAEANKIDGLFAADLLSFGAQGAIGAQEPLIFLAALSAVTTHVGLIATVTTTFHHPFNLARLFGTLDHVSNGRAAWNAVTSSLGEENYSDLDLPSPEERYARAAESLEVVNALFDSWKPGALIRGGEGSAVLDPSRVVPIEHRGKYFTVQGAVEHSIPAAASSGPIPGRPICRGYRTGCSLRGGRIHLSRNLRGRGHLHEDDPRQGGRVGGVGTNCH